MYWTYESHAGSVKSMATFVLIPGACHGAWCFDDLVGALRNRGHRADAHTLTGVAEQAHLAHAGVNLDTHITDMCEAVAAMPDDDLVLVGHSYGGMVITAVADRMPDRVDALVYLDALVPETANPVGTWSMTPSGSGISVSTTPATASRRCRSSTTVRHRIRWPRCCSRSASPAVRTASAGATTPTRSTGPANHPCGGRMSACATIPRGPCTNSTANTI